MYEGGWDSGGGGGGNAAGRRGGNLFPSLPTTAPTVPSLQPVTVISNTYFSLDAQKFAEAHGETIVRKGLSRPALMGR